MIVHVVLHLEMWVGRCLLSTLAEMAEAWRLGHFCGCRLMLWRDFFCYWSIWMKRNDAIFVGSSSLIEIVLEGAAFCVANWMSLKSSPKLN